jgi:hypothetical protein
LVSRYCPEIRKKKSGSKNPEEKIRKKNNPEKKSGGQKSGKDKIAKNSVKRFNSLAKVFFVFVFCAPVNTLSTCRCSRRSESVARWSLWMKRVENEKKIENKKTR